MRKDSKTFACSLRNHPPRAEGRQWSGIVILLLCLLASNTAVLRAQESPQPLRQDAQVSNGDRVIVRRGIRIDLQADLTPTRHPVIEIELHSERLFDGHNRIYSVRIGSHEFKNYDGTVWAYQLIVELTPKEFAKTKAGDLVVVKYGPTNPIEDKRLLRTWRFGPLDKDQVNRNPVRTYTGSSIGDSPAYSIDGKLMHAGPPIKIRSKTIDTRTHIPILSVIDGNIFPEQWLSHPIEARARGLSKKELKRSIYILDVAMSKYPILALRENIKAIYLLDSLTLYGVAADASHSEDSIYIVNAGTKAYTDEYLESLFHQTFSNLMQQKNNKGREPGRSDMPQFAPQKTAWELPVADPQMKLVYESHENGPQYIYALENTGFTGVTLLRPFKQLPPENAIKCPLRCQETNPKPPAKLQQPIKEHGFVYMKTVFEDAPVWSHDRKQIAFRSNRDSDSAELYVMQVDGSNLRRLTRTRHFAKLSSMVGAICWSPDDRWLAYVLQDEFGSNLFVVNSDGTGQKKLPIVTGKPDGIDGEGLSIDSVDRLVGWLPDGRILVVTERYFGGRTLYSILPDGTGLTTLTEKGDVVEDAVLSPDQNQIAIKTFGLIIKDLKSNSVRHRLVSPRGYGGVSWSPNSRLLAYGTGGLCIMDIESNTAPSCSRSVGESVYASVWSPDGMQIAYLVASNLMRNSASTSELRVMNANGTGDRHLSAGTGIPTWSPDGKYIIFSRERARIYLIKPDGSGERYIAKGIYPQWIP
jgi:Tol biopolymer transport system component